MKFYDLVGGVNGEVSIPKDTEVVVRVDDLLIVATAMRTELVGDKEYFVIETHPCLDKDYTSEMDAGIIPLDYNGDVDPDDVDPDDVNSPVAEDPS